MKRTKGGLKKVIHVLETNCKTNFIKHNVILIFLNGVIKDTKATIVGQTTQWSKEKGQNLQNTSQKTKDLATQILQRKGLIKLHQNGKQFLTLSYWVIFDFLILR